MTGNYQWTGKVAFGLIVILLYAGSYIGLRQHFTGNLINEEGYVVAPGLPFGPKLPQLPYGLHKACNIFYYPAGQIDKATTKRQMLFFAPFPVTPPHPNFYPTR